MQVFNNPFSIDRAEQLGDELFRFFAHHKRLDGHLRRKSLMVQGGRGSGKTMFFLYNTYKSRKNEALGSSLMFDQFIHDLELIGLHYRCDSNFVPAFQHKGVEKGMWESLFAHYLNLTLSKKLVQIVLDINSSVSKFNKIQYEIQGEVEVIFDKQGLGDFDTLLEHIKKEEIEVVKYINNVSRIDCPILTANGQLINLISESIISQEGYQDKSIHIFIDEYENLLEYQQILINTLIKHPSPAIFNIGSRNEGVKSNKTLAEGESIQSPHDYHYFNIESFKTSEFEELIIDVCKKRLSTIPELSKEPDDSKLLDIRYYLGEENVKNEIEYILGSSDSKESLELNNLYLEKLSRYTENEIEHLHKETDPLLKRLIVVLIERGNSVKEIQTELIKYHADEKSKFHDWIHNNANGIIFLMSKEYRKRKRYYGINTYISLSSGIIRYFIELCETAFRNASRNGFLFTNPRPLTEREQSEAAKHVSIYKLNDVETHAPYSRELKQLTILLGNVFERLHRNPKISEPEQNHFSTDFEMLSLESKNVLSYAVLYSVLQKRGETKDKSDAIDSNNLEFHLNHIFAPFFQISPRKKRKIHIKANLFEVLISGDIEKAESAANGLVGNKDKESSENQLFLKGLFK